MKKIIITFVILLLQGAIFSSAQELSINTVRKKINALEVEITFKNGNSRDVLITTPSRNNKFETTYFLIPEDKTGILVLKRYFFSYPSDVLDGIEPCFALTKVKAGESYKERVLLEYPEPQTHYLINTKINVKNFESIGFQIGILPSDIFINEIPSLRPFGQCAMGQDKISGGIFKGKTLLEIQRVLSTANFNLRN